MAGSEGEDTGPGAPQVSTCVHDRLAAVHVLTFLPFRSNHCNEVVDFQKLGKNL